MNSDRNLIHEWVYPKIGHKAYRICRRCKLKEDGIDLSRLVGFKGIMAHIYISDIIADKYLILGKEAYYCQDKEQ